MKLVNLTIPSSALKGCIDGLLWIGSSYKKFLCASRTTCATPFKWGKPHCFVHEAEWRGISRKLPRIPKWAVPGRTRIFLTYRDGLSRGSGRIFGYFVLGRLEVLLPDLDGQTGGGKKDEKIRIQKCWNGHAIITHQHVKRRWVRTKETCPDIPDIKCDEGARLTTRCPDGSLIDIAVCVNGHWKKTGKKCPKMRPIDCEKFKVPRDCPTQIPEKPGLRLVPGAVYAVDALDAAITDAFCRRLYQARIPDVYKQAKCDGNDFAKDQALEDAHRLFMEVAAETEKTHKRSVRLPDELVGVACVRGPLILFKEPPIYRAYPSASFQGLKHIDGNSLIEQISARERKVFVYSCQKPGRNSMTKAEIAGCLAYRNHLSQAFADKFLAALPDLAENELRARGVFGLHHLGTFRVQKSKGRSITNGETKKRLAALLECRQSAVGKLLDGLGALACEQLAAGRDFRIPALGTFLTGKLEVTFRETKRMSDLEARLTLRREIVDLQPKLTQ